MNLAVRRSAAWVDSLANHNNGDSCSGSACAAPPALDDRGQLEAPSPAPLDVNYAHCDRSPVTMRPIAAGQSPKRHRTPRPPPLPGGTPGHRDALRLGFQAGINAGSRYGNAGPWRREGR
jgi:hypothetical protein